MIYVIIIKVPFISSILIPLREASFSLFFNPRSRLGRRLIGYYYSS